MPSATSSRSRHTSAHVRTSQPAQREKKDDAGAAWEEPPLEQAKASYEDHGGAPFGVLEDMLPLGQAPNAKVRSRVRGEAGARKTALGKNAAGVISDTQDTPESTPAFDPPASTFDQNPLPGQPLLVFDDEKDQDYMPRKSKKTAKGRASRSSLARTAASSPANTPTPAAADSPSAPPPAPAPVSVPVPPSEPLPPEQLAQTPVTASSSTAMNGTPMPSTAKRTPRRSTPLPTLSPQIKMARSNLEEIFEAAVRRSREVNNPKLGLALREIHKQSLQDQSMMDLLAAILDQRATPEQVVIFRDHVGRAKRRIKGGEDSNHKSRKSPSHTHGANTSASPSPSKPAPPPELIPRQSIEAPVALPRPKISIRVNPPKKTSITIQPKNKDIRAMMSKPRSQSVSSTSSLSSLTSLEEDAMDVDSDDDTKVASAARTVATSTPYEMAQPNGLTVEHPLASRPLKRTSAEAEMDDREKALLVKKQRLGEGIDREDRSRPSYERTERTESTHSFGVDGNAIIPPVQLRANGHKRRSNKVGSPDMGSPLTDISSPPSTGRASPQRGPAKTIKKKAKTKQSPTKKQTANYGGEANGSGGRESPIAYDDNEESDNNDFCSSCRGSGYLLCCDGCDRSFHFACLDPPLSQDASELQEPWFCFKCVAKRAQPQRHSRGLFSTLLSSLDKRNPSIFSLPQSIRDHFEGVATGKDGRFMEAVNGKTRSRTGYDELPDNFKTKDSKGQSILCYHCGLSSMGRREIITCDLCNAHWHLDCLDPPLANAPYRDQWGKKVRDWLCPLHIDHELREMDISRLAAREIERDRKVYMRRPRNAKVVDTSLNRGFVNDGVIEVINDDSEDDEEFFEEEVSGIVYRLPEKGIKLDFIDHIHLARCRMQPVLAPTPPPSRLSKPDFLGRSFLEQQTALSLVQFANQDKGLEISSDQVETLLGTLIAEAPADVVEKILEAERQDKLASEEEGQQQRKNLELLQALIAKKIATLPKD